mmetsp:Transcript_15287/g.35810  ORF Transcript_15287/g.35810 Transcript_15287/m.35810 type:complete len:423 (-) Transcript_15287:957-2225(-)
MPAEGLDKLLVLLARNVSTPHLANECRSLSHLLQTLSTHVVDLLLGLVTTCQCLQLGCSVILSNILFVGCFGCGVALSAFPSSVEALAVQRKLELSLCKAPSCATLSHYSLANHHAHPRLYAYRGLCQEASPGQSTSPSQKAPDESLHLDSGTSHLCELHPSQHAQCMPLDGDGRTDSSQPLPHLSPTGMPLNCGGCLVHLSFTNAEGPPVRLNFGGTFSANINPISILQAVLVPRSPEPLNLLRGNPLKVHLLGLRGRMALRDDLVPVLGGLIEPSAADNSGCSRRTLHNSIGSEVVGTESGRAKLLPSTVSIDDVHYCLGWIFKSLTQRQCLPPRWGQRRRRRNRIRQVSGKRGVLEGWVDQILQLRLAQCQRRLLASWRGLHRRWLPRRGDGARCLAFGYRVSSPSSGLFPESTHRRRH